MERESINRSVGIVSDGAADWTDTACDALARPIARASVLWIVVLVATTWSGMATDWPAGTCVVMGLAVLVGSQRPARGDGRLGGLPWWLPALAFAGLHFVRGVADPVPLLPFAGLAGIAVAFMGGRRATPLHPAVALVSTLGLSATILASAAGWDGSLASGVDVWPLALALAAGGWVLALRDVPRRATTAPRLVPRTVLALPFVATLVGAFLSSPPDALTGALALIAPVLLARVAQRRGELPTGRDEAIARARIAEHVRERPWQGSVAIALVALAVDGLLFATRRACQAQFGPGYSDTGRWIVDLPSLAGFAWQPGAWGLLMCALVYGPLQSRSRSGRLAPWFIALLALPVLSLVGSLPLLANWAGSEGRVPIGLPDAGALTALLPLVVGLAMRRRRRAPTRHVGPLLVAVLVAPASLFFRVDDWNELAQWDYDAAWGPSNWSAAPWLAFVAAVPVLVLVHHHVRSGVRLRALLAASALGGAASGVLAVAVERWQGYSASPPTAVAAVGEHVGSWLAVAVAVAFARLFVPGPRHAERMADVFE